MIGLDTNIIVRYLLNDDPVQSPIAARLMESDLKTKGPGFISLVTITETAWVLKRFYGFPKEEVSRVIEELLGSDLLFFQNEREVYTAMIALRKGHASFADALVGALGLWAGCPATLTFDRKATRSWGFEAIS